MKIFIKVKPNSKKEYITRIDQPSLGLDDKRENIKKFVIAIKEPPIKGKANNAIIKLLSEYFQIPQQNIKIINGLKSKNKIVKIE